MKSRYDVLQSILEYCKRHNTRKFYQFDVNVHSRSIGSLCDTPYRGNIWIVRICKSKKRDGTNGRWQYRLAYWVDLSKIGSVE